MRKLLILIIVGCLTLPGLDRANAAPAVSTSNWPALNADGAQSNNNPNEQTITAKNVLNLKVRWAQIIDNPVNPNDVSYPVVDNGRVYIPIVANGKVHVKVVDASSGKQLAIYPKDAVNGMLVSGGVLFLAGHVLQMLDANTGEKLAQINASPAVPGGAFVYPQADGKVVVAGYAAGAKSSIYTVNPNSNEVVRQVPSTTAFGTLADGRIVTATTSGSAFYDETSGRTLAHSTYSGSYWFAGSTLAYTVVSATGKAATLRAVDATGKRVWQRVVGPNAATHSVDWPHAVGPNVVYVETERPSSAVLALDSLTGHPLWSRAIPNLQSMVLANGLLYVLTYYLGEPTKLVVLNASTGAMIGAIVLSDGYYAFHSPNSLMVANGMVFIRAVGPGGPQLVALGLKQK